MTKEELQKWVNETPMNDEKRAFAQWVIDSTAVWQFRVRKQTIQKMLETL